MDSVRDYARRRAGEGVVVRFCVLCFVLYEQPLRRCVWCPGEVWPVEEVAKAIEEEKDVSPRTTIMELMAKRKAGGKHGGA